ncbi:uncharacterized protein FIESC28_02131 [Fusarium coffeatum]|uniref:Fungal lipase-type domain-containing protein n=1 Tax=Fusarium coffeatum TaxID=231269 RepID=A0A366S6X5_9HYPO|nr:uncharacterized protein FIESC28_02131 [Fusarium coffeatum]RBR25074.1 hypothetical protein FIESC28_02131 [Fusarium coffeatum]
MEPTDTLISDYINFDDQKAGLTGAELRNKEFTFCAAAAVSHLCDEQENGSNLDECLHLRDDFELIRELDLISSVYSIAPINKQTGISPTPPLIACADVRTQAAGGMGSRFYQDLIERGLEFVPLVEWLMTRYKVVVCGHSFGGALATASPFLSISDHQSIPNIWQEGMNGISVITFGSAPCHFNEPQGTTASWKIHVSKNFHHVINPHDYVPFVLNDASRRFEQDSNSPRTKSGKFCHFGCIYSISTECPGIQSCLQILTVGDLPQIPVARDFGECYKMSHYYHCVKSSIGAKLPQDVLPENHRGVSFNEIPSLILPMPDTVMNCSCVVDIDRLTISLAVDTAIIHYLLEGAFFKYNEKDIPFSSINYLLHPKDHSKSSVELGYMIEDNDTFERIGRIAIAVQQAIILRDVFGRSMAIKVDMGHLSLDRASRSDTFESLRLAMVHALVAQTSKVKGFKTEDASTNNRSPKQVIELDDKARFVANHIDSLVSDASPHLIVSQMGRAFDILKKRWPRDFETDIDLYFSIPGQFTPGDSDGGLLSDVLADCPRVLRKLITDMSESEIRPRITKGEATIKAWTNANRPTLAQKFANVPSFARALEKFSEDLYRRPTNSSKRTEQAISQFQDIMGVIQLCHLIIITQLDAPYEWYCSFTEGRPIASVTLGMLPSLFSWAQYCSSRIINHLLHRHSEYLDLSFSGVLITTLDALGISLARPDDMVEKMLLDHVKEDLPSSHTQETLEKWRARLETGLKNYPDARKNHWSIKPDYFWSKWLFAVALVAQLRMQPLNKICIGVQGSMEAGKSQMLTVLTGAPKDLFKPRSRSLCRTLGIQSYNASQLSASFLESPGFDDQIPQIKYMAEVYQELFAVVIIVIPMGRIRSQATENTLRIAVRLLLDHDDKRPLRILLSQADGLHYHRNNKEAFRATLRDVKEQFMSRLRNEVGEDFTSFRRRRLGKAIMCFPETLDDIVKPFSTHAQMDLDGIRALSDCGSNYSCKIERASHFENLWELADAGEIWDIESLRSWLRELSPRSVPMSDGRVRQYRD